MELPVNTDMFAEKDKTVDSNCVTHTEQSGITGSSRQNVKMIKPNCYACFQTFRTKFSLSCHLKTHHGNSDECCVFKCPICLVELPSNDEVVSHIEEKHNTIHVVSSKKESKYDYTYWYMSKDEQFALFKHRISTGTPLITEKDQRDVFPSFCVKCDVVFYNEKDLKKHNKEHHGRRVYTTNQYMCDICGLNFKRSNCLKEHLRAHDKPDTCSICGKKVAVLQKHLFNCHRDLKFQCDKCDKSYVSKQALRRHVATVHEGKTISCEICNDTFSSKYALSKHMKGHIGFHKFKCDDCGKVFSTIVLLNQHMTHHNGYLKKLNK